MPTIIDTISRQTFKVKKVCKIVEMPKSATPYWTAFTPNGLYDIYRTDTGVLYSKPVRQVN